MKMKPIAIATLWSAMSFLVLALAAAAIGVYGFDGYEKAWGRGPSFQVMSWVACFLSIVIGVFAALGFKLARVPLLGRPKYCGALVGILAAVVTVVAAVVLPRDSELGGLPLLSTLGFLSLFGAVFVARTLGRGEQHAA